MRRLEKEGFKYKDYCLGDLVLYENTQAKIVGFDLSYYSNIYIAIEVSDEIINRKNLNHENIKVSNVDNLVYMETPKNYFMWVYPKEIKPLHKSKSIFKVRQRVWDCLRGWGEVVEVREQEMPKIAFPVGVKFERAKDKTTVWYTETGRLAHVLNRTLFFEEIKIPESALKPKRWRAVKDIEDYYFVNSFGLIIKSKDDYSIYGNTHYKIGNYFKTEEDAESSELYKAFKIERGFVW